jgi:hypothetical protein
MRSRFSWSTFTFHGELRDYIWVLSLARGWSSIQGFISMLRENYRASSADFCSSRGGSSMKAAIFKSISAIDVIAFSVSILRKLNRLVANASNQCQIIRPIRDCPKTKSRVRLSYHADQSFHEGTSCSSGTASPPPRHPPRRPTGREYRGWANCADSSEETRASNKTGD